MPDDTIIIYSQSDAQDLVDQIKITGRPLDLTDATVAFRMRYADSDQVKVDANAQIDDESSGKVSYAWEVVDLDTPGEYYGWWSVTLVSGEKIDTPEFLIIVATHAPGLRTRTGAIYTRLISLLPITVNALSRLDDYGDKKIQDIIEQCKFGLFVDVVDVEDEVELDIRVQSYIAKLTALELIPAGVDYWASQYVTLTTGGGTTNEIASYPDRIAALWKIYERFLVEVRNESTLIEELLGTPVTVRPSSARPEVRDAVDEGFITPSPHENFIDYAFPGRRANRNWWNVW